jgi:hypothetical protein
MVKRHGGMEDRSRALKQRTKTPYAEARESKLTKNAIRVAADASRGLFIQARGEPAKIVAYGAAAAVTFVGVAVSYGAYDGIRRLFGPKT